VLGAKTIFEVDEKPESPRAPEKNTLDETTLAEYWERFTLRARGEIAEATFDQYKQKFTRYLKRHPGDTKLKEITRGAIRDWRWSRNERPGS